VLVLGRFAFWADRGTVGLLNHVAHNVNANSMLLIGAYRDAEVDRMHPLAGAFATLRRLPDFEILSLKGLKSGDVVELLGIIGDQDAPEALVQTLSAETEGNPLFIREVLLPSSRKARFCATRMPRRLTLVVLDPGRFLILVWHRLQVFVILLGVVRERS